MSEDELYTLWFRATTIPNESYSMQGWYELKKVWFAGYAKGTGDEWYDYDKRGA